MGTVDFGRVVKVQNPCRGSKIVSKLQGFEPWLFSFLFVALCNDSLLLGISGTFQPLPTKIDHWSTALLTLIKEYRVYQQPLSTIIYHQSIIIKHQPVFKLKVAIILNHHPRWISVAPKALLKDWWRIGGRCHPRSRSQQEGRLTQRNGSFLFVDKVELLRLTLIIEVETLRWIKVNHHVGSNKHHWTTITGDVGSHKTKIFGCWSWTFPAGWTEVTKPLRGFKRAVAGWQQPVESANRWRHCTLLYRAIRVHLPAALTATQMNSFAVWLTGTRTTGDQHVLHQQPEWTSEHDQPGWPSVTPDSSSGCLPVLSINRGFNLGLFTVSITRSIILC